MGDIAGLTDGIGVVIEIGGMPRPLDVGIPKLGVKLCEEDVGCREAVGAAEVCIWLFTGSNGGGKLDTSPADHPVEGCGCIPVDTVDDHPVP
jgi:hypothetical protein